MATKWKLVFTSAFNEYVEQRQIGEGGSGIVYEVLDSDGRQYDLKCLKADVLAPKKRKRFKNEIDFCLKNGHENVIVDQDYGTTTMNDREAPFYVMPYYLSTLRHLMEEGIDRDKILPYFS